MSKAAERSRNVTEQRAWDLAVRVGSVLVRAVSVQCIWQKPDCGEKVTIVGLGRMLQAFGRPSVKTKGVLVG